MADHEKPPEVDAILETHGLADALETDRFKRFLDHVPIAIAVSEIAGDERVIYVNQHFERLSGLSAADVLNRNWDVLRHGDGDEAHIKLSDALRLDQEHLGSFRFDGQTNVVDAWSNVIEDDDGNPIFRLVAMAMVGRERAEATQQLEEKDTLLRELQHRVKNNLQMITALIRMEARQLPEAGERFNRLAGRVEALSLLYTSLSVQESVEEIDLGVYLSQVAAAVMRAHGVEGIRLDLKVDTWPVSINVAMPTGLVVNELMTNALKHAFEGREGGTIKLHSLVDDTGCRVTVSDDGVGLPQGMVWPPPEKLSALIVKSLTQNAGARLDVRSAPREGMKVSIEFSRRRAASGTPKHAVG